MPTEELLDDEMPTAPAQDDSVPFGSNDQVVIEDSMDMEEDVKTAEDFNALYPKGVYHLKLRSYTQSSFPNDDGHGADPQYGLLWEIVSPPKYAGKTYIDNLPAVREYDLKLARMGDPDAKRKKEGRYAKTRNLIEALGWNLPRNFKLKTDVLDKNPEVNAEIIETDKKKFDEESGKWVKSGEKKNKINKFMKLGK